MRCRPMVVLPLPAEPCTAMRPDDGCVISSNWRGSMSAAMAGRWRSGRARARRPRTPACRASRRRRRRRGAPRAAGARARRRAALPSRATCSRACRVAISRHCAGAQVARERPLRRGHPPQLGVDDGDRAARERSRPRPAGRPAAPRSSRLPRSDRRGATRARSASRRSARRRPARRSCAAPISTSRRLPPSSRRRCPK